MGPDLLVSVAQDSVDHKIDLDGKPKEKLACSQILIRTVYTRTRLDT